MNDFTDFNMITPIPYIIGVIILKSVKSWLVTQLRHELDAH